MRLSAAARIVALLLAVLGIFGLTIQTNVSLEKAGTLAMALWSMGRFFTIIGNSLTALVLLGVALGLRWAGRPTMLGGVTLFMALIGIVYATVLRQTEHLGGQAQLANYIMHYLMPPLVALYWLAFAPKGGLTRIDPLNWALLPLAYFLYALARGHLDGKYPYPFLDVAVLGLPRVLTNAAIIAGGFLLAGLLLVCLDRALGRSGASDP